MVSELFQKLCKKSIVIPVSSKPLNLKNAEREKNQKFEYLKNDFLDEIKSVFYNYLRAIICWIKEK